MKPTTEQIAADRCRDLALAATAAAHALADVGTYEARLHSCQCEGAASIAESWANELERQHRAKQEKK